jgi:phosphopantetheine adenylyltransferase
MNPPHLGHILTLLKIKDDYDKIIVALSDYDFDGAKPSVMQMSERKRIVHSVLKYFPQFEIIDFKGAFRKRTDFSDLPKFDIVVTASKGVYDNVLKQGLKAILIERTPFYRGEDIRRAMQNDY